MTLERNDDVRLGEQDAADANLTYDDELGSGALEADGQDAEEIEVAEIRAEIEETRVEMGDTLQELGDRLDPGNLVQEAKDNVREATIGRVEETAKGMTDMVMETIKRNPIPAAMAGAGLALLWMNRSSGSSNGNGSSMRYGRYTPYAYDGRYDDRWASQGQGQGQGQGITDRAGDVASSVGETVGDTVGQVGQRVGEVGQTVGSTVGRGVEQTAWRIESLMNSSPLAVGAIAIGAGALVGAVLPETPEQRILAEPARAVGDTVRQAVSQATDRVEESLDEVERQQTQGGTSGS